MQTVQTKRIVLAVLSAVLSSVAVAQVTGSGTTNQVPKFTGATTIGNSAITESNGNVGIGTTSPAAKLYVAGGQFGSSGSANQAAYALGAQSIAADASIYSYGAICTGNGHGNCNSNNGVVLGIVNPSANNNIPNVGNVLLNSGNVGIGTTSPDGRLNITGLPNTWTSNGWSKGLRLDGVSAIELGGGASTKYGIGQSGNILYFFDTTADDASAAANYRMAFSGGNIGIGTVSPTAKLEVNGNLRITAGSGGSVTFPDGSTQSTAWTGALCGGDYAESVDVTGDRTHFEPGDVLVIDPSSPGRFLKSAEPYSPLVSGIYSTKPGAVGRRQRTPKSEAEVPMAMIGIVPVKVSAENGAIAVGDLLVTSSTAGRAMKATDPSKTTGRVLGKALGSLNSGTGVIEVLVTLQ